MNNNKGFTLTEVLLAAMIVGIIGIALAALTTAALRESGVGRSRLMLRNQLSLFLRQLRQDVREASSVSVSSDSITLSKSQLGPNMSPSSVTYSCSGSTCGSTCTRNGNEIVLSHVCPNLNGWGARFRTVSPNDSYGSINSILEVRLVVGMDTKPPIKEALQETIILPQGFPIKQD